MKRTSSDCAGPEVLGPVAGGEAALGVVRAGRTHAGVAGDVVHAVGALLPLCWETVRAGGIGGLHIDPLCVAGASLKLRG